MPTTNIVTTRTGTGWTVDVTACNLLPALTIKDFIVLLNGSITTNTNFTKTTATSLTYSGPSLGASTSVEVRRKTPNSVVQVARFGTRVRSDDYNNEFDRQIRWREEADLNGVGAGSIVTVATPQNDPYGVLWASDTLFPPSRKVVYDKLETMPTNTSLASTLGSYVLTSSLGTTLSAYAPLASPTFTGNPVAATQSVADNSTRLATTAFVKTSLLNATSQTYSDEGSAVATGFKDAQKLRLHVEGLVSNLTVTLNSQFDITGFNTPLVARASEFTASSGIFKPSITGIYRITTSTKLTGTLTGGSIVYHYMKRTSDNVAVGETTKLYFDSVEFADSYLVKLVGGVDYRPNVFVAATSGTCTLNASFQKLSIEWVAVG